ncbi:MAG: transaldolase, partial [Chloroflexi bacterium]
QAVERGVAQAQEKGVDLTRWRSVITMMIGRLTERKALVEQARRRGIELTWQDKHWFGIAVFRRAYRILQDRGAVSKLLACSLRHGPVVAGKPRFWDIEKLAGGEIVFTFPPYVLEPLFAIGDDLHFRPQIEEEVPEEVMDKLIRIPYVIQAYDPNGMALEQFNTHPATLYTIEQFSKAASGLEAFVAERIALVREAVPAG